MNKLLLSSFILLPSFLFSSDLEELLTYDVGVENQLLFSRRCSALNFYFATFIPDFDQKAEEHGYFFNTISGLIFSIFCSNLINSMIHPSKKHVAIV